MKMCKELIGIKVGNTPEKQMLSRRQLYAGLH